MIGFSPFFDDGAAGFISHRFVLEIDQHLASDKRFTNFINKYSEAAKWFLVSDYSLGDKNKPNDCVCFTLIPHVSEVNVLLDRLAAIAPSDVKSVRTVNAKFVSLLNRYPMFTIGIVLDKKRRLAADERAYFHSRIESLLKQLDIWDETTPEGRPFNSGYRAKLLKLQAKLVTKSVNIKLVRDTEIISTLAGYLASAATNPSTKVVGWFSDRDSILSHMTGANEYPLAFDFAHTFHHMACIARDIDPAGIMAFGLPETSGRMWYDALVRIPDLICGTLADYNLKTNQVSHPKYVPVVQNVLTNTEKTMFYKLSILAEGYDFKEVKFHNSQH